MGRYNKQNFFNQTLKKKKQIKLSNSYNYWIVANLLPRVNIARPATGSGRLEKVLWEFLPIKMY